MSEFQKAFQRGKEVREKQDEILGLFVKKIQTIDDMETLRGIEKELRGGGSQ